MNASEAKSIHERSIAFYGVNESKDKVAEELAELIQAIMRNERHNIIEECADVYNALDKLKLIYSIKDVEVERHRKEKMERLVSRMGFSNLH